MVTLLNEASFWQGKCFGCAEMGSLPDRHTRHRTVWSEEALHMELLAQKEDEEILDNGAKEGSGDEYKEIRGKNVS